MFFGKGIQERQYKFSGKASDHQCDKCYQHRFTNELVDQLCSESAYNFSHTYFFHAAYCARRGEVHEVENGNHKNEDGGGRKNVNGLCISTRCNIPQLLAGVKVYVSYIHEMRYIVRSVLFCFRP